MIHLSPLTSSSKAENDQEVSEEQGRFQLLLLGGLHLPCICRTSKWDCQKSQLPLEKKNNNASVGKTESTRRNTGVPDEHSCTQAAAEVSMVYMPDCCQAEHVWLGRKGKAAKCSTVHVSGREASLTDVFLRLTLFCTGLENA